MQHGLMECCIGTYGKGAVDLTVFRNLAETREQAEN
jgi:hypothetical protein